MRKRETGTGGVNVFRFLGFDRETEYVIGVSDDSDLIITGTNKRELIWFSQGYGCGQITTVSRIPVIQLSSR